MTRSTISSTEELPIAAHIFEGHLYIFDDKTNKWTWRLFRFNGTSLTCLSSRKIKLPPHTLLDNPCGNVSTSSHHHPLYSLTHSASTHSFTSPLLATPKKKTDRILAGSCSLVGTATCSNAINNKTTQPISASYYQLPKWTVDMINISSISLLKPKHRKSKGFFTSATASSSKSFTVRTFDGACYTLKAGSQHDLERWIFILVKTWKFAQAARQMHKGDLMLNHSTALSVNNSGSTTDLASIHSASRQMTSPIQASRQQHRNVFIATHVGQRQSSKQHKPMLSNEKALRIEEWVKSLVELDTYTDKADVVNHKSRSLPSHQMHKHDRNQQLQTASSNTIKSARVKAEKLLHRYNSDYMSYFQDANTAYTNDTNNPTQKEPKQSLKYHNSVQARPILSHSVGSNVPIPLSADVLVRNPEILEMGCSPLDLLEYRYSQQEKVIPSPPATPVAALEVDEDTCLADVCKTLQHLEIDKRQTEQEMMAKRRSAITMVNASRKGNDDDGTNGWYSKNSWAPYISTKDRNNRLSTTVAFT
ncbi:hypothetical protein [Parasitella parasitica]|uniref:PH domain-containing protein n=1 Tax=Parasitella parasitica TaxID=35722 RepID=A0A0B7N5R8_9FUNG|nr:hypothetical protein [Parasitella parasitica]